MKIQWMRCAKKKIMNTGKDVDMAKKVVRRTGNAINARLNMKSGLNLVLLPIPTKTQVLLPLVNSNFCYYYIVKSGTEQ